MTNLRCKRQDHRALFKKNVDASETQNRAKRWISVCSSATCAVLAHQSVFELIQSAKTLVLVDEFNREYKHLQRPADVVAKTDDSLRLSDTLRNGSLSDDRKVREYVAELHRYLNIDKKAPDKQTVKFNWATEPVSMQTPVVRKQKRKKTATKKVAKRTLQ